MYAGLGRVVSQHRPFVESVMAVGEGHEQNGGEQGFAWGVCVVTVPLNVARTRTPPPADTRPGRGWSDGRLHPIRCHHLHHPPANITLHLSII